MASSSPRKIVKTNYSGTTKYISISEIEKVRTIYGAESVVMYANCGHLEIKKRYPGEYVEVITKFFDTHSDTKTYSENLNV